MKITKDTQENSLFTHDTQLNQPPNCCTINSVNLSKFRSVQTIFHSEESIRIEMLSQEFREAIKRHFARKGSVAEIMYSQSTTRACRSARTSWPMQIGRKYFSGEIFKSPYASPRWLLSQYRSSRVT